MPKVRNTGPEQDVFVRREDFDQYFQKPIPKATFHRWVNDGKIKKARDLDGWYRLNATLVHQGLPPVDVNAYRAKLKTQTREYRKKQLLYAAFVDVDGALEFTFDDIELPDALEQKEVDFIMKASNSIQRYFETNEIRDRYLKSLYCKDLLDENVQLDVLE